MLLHSNTGGPGARSCRAWRRTSTVSLLVGVAAVLLCARPAGASIIEFWTGMTGAGATRYHWYDDHDLGPHDPTGEFTAARTGPQAVLRTDAPNGWGTLPGYDCAIPVFTSNLKLTDWTQPFDFSWGKSSLFAVPLNVPSGTFSAATLYLEYSVDNYLGGAANGDLYQGIFLNGQPLSGNTFTAEPTGQRFVENQVLWRGDIGPMLVPGTTNWLYFNVSDKFPLAGLMAAGRISMIPEPESVVVWICVLVVCLGYWRLLVRRQADQRSRQIVAWTSQDGTDRDSDVGR